MLFFSGVGARDGKFQYWRVGKSLGTHCLFLSDSRKHWYQDGVEGLGASVDETVANIRQRAAALGVVDIYAIGQSMGAHGAILYGAKLGASVLAFGAETILGLEASRSERLLNGGARILYPDLHDVVATAQKPIFAFAGEQDPVDIYCMSRLLHLPAYHARTLAGRGHHLANDLHASGRLIPMMQAFVSGRPIERLAEEGNVLACPGFAEAFYDLRRHTRAGRRAEALEAGRKASSLCPRSDHALYLTAKALVELRQPAQARPLLESALAITPDNISYRFLMARCIARLGDPDRAMVLHEEIIALVPDFAPAFNQIAGIHFQRGDYFAARKASRRALELQPGTPGFVTFSERIEKKIAGLPASSRREADLAPEPLATRVSNLFRTLKGTVARRS
ncbi:tetratricopeptide repeat protein [Mesorhizobium sp. IMUNJ 23232]|uniref:tetratricopeptide repeat protein n=1 Tax=Mesorhizobium sp. IMUNJ 23232 TaxID=3376064 RepID=UPI0037CA3294